MNSVALFHSPVDCRALSHPYMVNSILQPRAFLVYDPYDNRAMECIPLSGSIPTKELQAFVSCQQLIFIAVVRLRAPPSFVQRTV